ncbi:23080_t:CDS:1 [Cetraspora pellucida]|uniref:23080_t:CDS:1 n=1 Tax=Cetraspora pellucida TaxID=1433469 RepID=A0A9N8YYV7_9GLOM|nr:23080_t:CDS:1 [Cetraspora pellucida]
MHEKKFIITLLIHTFLIYTITAQSPGSTTPGASALPGVGGMPPMGGPPKLPFGDKKLGNPPPTAPQPQQNLPVSQQQQPNPQTNQQPNPQTNQQQSNSPVNRQQPNSPKASSVPNGVTDQDAHKTHETENAKQIPSPSTNAAKHSSSPQSDSDPRHNETAASNGGFKNVGCGGLTMGIVTVIMMSLWIYGVA